MTTARINEHKGQLLAGQNALWPTQSKFCVGHVPLVPPCSAPCYRVISSSADLRCGNGTSKTAWRCII